MDEKIKIVVLKGAVISGKARAEGETMEISPEEASLLIGYGLVEEVGAEAKTKPKAKAKAEEE